MKLLFVGSLWEGSTTLQRLRAFERIDGIDVHALDAMGRPTKSSLADRIRHRLGRPADKSRVNQRLLATLEAVDVDVLFVDGLRIITLATLERARRRFRAKAVYYSPDDVSAHHNRSRQLASCEREWDVVFTTKSFNVPELRARGVQHPVLIGNAFDPLIHRPLTAAEVGTDYERFDVVFTGTFERQRLLSLNELARTGIEVVVYGDGWSRATLDRRITLRLPAYGLDYVRSLHTGKITLCFLRKINRDRQTTRSVEIPAAQRPMVAEKTDEHDALFVDGSEYVGFTHDRALIFEVRRLLGDAGARTAIGVSGWERCLSSGYSTDHRAREMLAAVERLA